MDLWIATSNAHKLKEFINLSFSSPFKIRTPKELDFYSSPAETGSSFLENAQIKARSLHKTLSDKKAWVLAEDSGLVVDGLGGLPGIHSARYAGEKARDSENNAKLLKMMSFKSPETRSAHYMCEIFVISPDGEESHFPGQMNGQIAKKLSGTGGFGYDPLFIPDGQTQCLADLGDAFKNKHSHRATAYKAFLKSVL